MRHGKRIPALVLYPVAWSLLILVLLVLIEGAASWALAVRSVAFGDPSDRHTRYDSLLGWSSEPGRIVEQAYGPGAPVRINSLGFRGEEIDPVTREGRVRMVCSGDSFTFGEGVGNGRDWCHVLARLNESLEPVNMGQPGYGVDQAYLWYMRDGLPLNPDVHVFAFVEGGFTRMLTAVRYGAGKPILRVSGGQLEVGNVPVPRLRHTIGRAIERAELRLVRLGSGLRRRLAKYGNTNAVEAVPPVASLLFDRLRDVNERQGIATILVYLPTEVDLRKPSGMLEMVESLAADLGLNLVDLTPALRVLPAHEAAGMFLADGHYSVEGNRWVAEVLSKRLRALGVPGVSQPVAGRPAAEVRFAAGSPALLGDGGVRPEAVQAVDRSDTVLADE